MPRALAPDVEDDADAAQEGNDCYEDDSGHVGPRPSSFGYSTSSPRRSSDPQSLIDN